MCYPIRGYLAKAESQLKEGNKDKNSHQEFRLIEMILAEFRKIFDPYTP
jgi:hypothetical protein